ncbi:MAG: hypothetical protein ABI459_04100 [Deltaproteobacteria bacterium]
MDLLFGLTIYGVCAVVLAFLVLLQRHFANKSAIWPDDNVHDDEAARQNVLRALTLALMAFALVGVLLGAIEGHVFVFLPLAATALIAIAVVRVRMRGASVTESDERSNW